jgi:pimeloyl-ACP methyl ester carboxylesterase
LSSNKIQHLKVPRILIYIGKILQSFSVKWTTLYLSKLFTTPIKHKIPKRELQMDRNSIQTKIYVPEIKKDIIVYQLGTGEKKILLAHGWSGRGTQLVKFADALVAKGYTTVSFDAPAHGKSPGNTTIMTDFIASIVEVDRKFGPFDAAVGHSLGGMSLLNAVKLGLKINRLVTIGSGDKVKDILIDFVAKLELKQEFSTHLQQHFEKKYNTEMESYSAYLAAQSITIPVLVIHDEEDNEVPVWASKNIFANLKNGELLITNNLGHRKILGNQEVIDKTINFII